MEVLKKLFFAIKDIIILILAYFFKNSFGFLNNLFDTSGFIPKDKKDEIYVLFYVALIKVIFDIIIVKVEKILNNHEMKLDVIAFKSGETVSLKSVPIVLVNKDYYVGKINFKIKVSGRLRKCKIILEFPKWVQIQSEEFIKLGEEFYELNLNQFVGREKGNIEYFEREISVGIILSDMPNGNFNFVVMSKYEEVEKTIRKIWQRCKFQSNSFMIKMEGNLICKQLDG